MFVYFDDIIIGMIKKLFKKQLTIKTRFNPENLADQKAFDNACEILEPVKVKWKTPSRLSPAGKQIGEKDRVSIDMKRIAFMIGLGYRDKTGWYPKETNYSIPSEYVKWK